MRSRLPRWVHHRRQRQSGYLQEFGCSFFFIAGFTVIFGMSMSKEPRLGAPWVGYLVGFGISTGVVLLFWGLPALIETLATVLRRPNETDDTDPGAS